MEKMNRESRSEMSGARGTLVMFKAVMVCFAEGNRKVFEGCKLLHKTIEVRKVNEESVTHFYRNMGWSKDHGARLKKVGEVFKDYESDQMVAYLISHLTRLAALGQVGKYIVDNKLVFRTGQLDLLKKNQGKIDLEKIKSTDDFISLVKRLKTGSMSATGGDQLSASLPALKESAEKNDREKIQDLAARIETKMAGISDMLFSLNTLVDRLCDASKEDEVSIPRLFKYRGSYDETVDWFSDSLKTISDLKLVVLDDGGYRGSPDDPSSLYPVNEDSPSFRR